MKTAPKRKVPPKHPWSKSKKPKPKVHRAGLSERARAALERTRRGMIEMAKRRGERT